MIPILAITGFVLLLILTDWVAKQAAMWYIKRQNRNCEMKEAEVIRRSLLSVKVCVPSDWTDERVVEFAEREYPCGTKKGWRIRPGRFRCENDATMVMVHIVLDA